MGKETVCQPLDGVWTSIDLTKETPFPSNNRNRGEPLPGGADWKPDSAVKFVRRYQKAGVKKFFFWLSPCARFEEIERDVLAAGMWPFKGARYPILARRLADLPAGKTEFTIRRFERKHDAKYFADYPDAEMRERILRPKQIKGLEHFVAWEDKTPVAIGRLFVRDRLAYLCGAVTLKPYRERGAQSALIVARLARAKELNCDWAMSETITMAKHSLSNLQRLGFEIVFWKKVFQSS
jgi:GNAT superfamily N-acetyltransferase